MSNNHNRIFYDQGWNAKVNGEKFTRFSSRDWQDGWRDCSELPQERQVVFPEFSKTKE